MSLCIIFIKNKKYLTIACSSILILIIIGLNSLKPADFIATYYKNTISIEFIYGIALYHFYKYVNERKISLNKIAKIIVLSILSIASYSFSMFGLIFVDFNKILFQEDYRYLSYGIPALIFVASILFLEEEIKKIKIMRFGVELGEASYVMYLIHFFTINLIIRCFKMADANGIFIITSIKIMLVFAITIFFSIIIHRFIDKPIQNYFRNMLRKYKKCMSKTLESA